MSSTLGSPTSLRGVTSGRVAAGRWRSATRGTLAIGAGTARDEVRAWGGRKGPGLFETLAGGNAGVGTFGEVFSLNDGAPVTGEDSATDGACTTAGGALIRSGDGG